MFYGAQIWGFQKFDDVEKLFRFFIKKMLFLPKNTPNYMLYLETGLNSLYSETLKAHFDYVNRALSLPEHRLPRTLAEIIIEKGTYWAEDWTNLCTSIRFTPENALTPLCMYSGAILDSLKAKEIDDHNSDAMSSQFHDLYSQLVCCIKPASVLNFSSRAASLLIKARGGLLDLNARCFKKSTIGLCTLCNLDATETTFHLIGVCPIYKEYRLEYFRKRTLTVNEVVNILNDTSLYNRLYKFLESSLKYRKLIVDEYS